MRALLLLAAANALVPTLPTARRASRPGASLVSMAAIDQAGRDLVFPKRKAAANQCGCARIASTNASRREQSSGCCCPRRGRGRSGNATHAS